MITVLAGGTGSIKIIRGLASCTSDFTIISNIGDNFWFNDLYICPDIDTCIYGLAGILDKERGWGIRKDTFYYLNCMKLLGKETWFQIGDKDLITHLIRTTMLSKGFSLSTIVKWMAGNQFNINNQIIPVSDSHVETRIVTNKGDMNIQEFWVKNKAISGPAGKYLKAKGIESSAKGIAKFYSQLISKIVIDNSDSDMSKEINKIGVSSLETNILMNNAKEEKRLARLILN